MSNEVSDNLSMYFSIITYAITNYFQIYLEHSGYLSKTKKRPYITFIIKCNNSI